MFRNIFKNKVVLITGNTGFKGSWLSLWLNSLGAKIYGLSNQIPTTPSNYDALGSSDYTETFFIDLRDREKLEKIIKSVKPDFIFHLAAQAIVGKSYENPIETFSTNAIGTINVLEALRRVDKETIAILITSDKVYNNVEWKWGYRETDQLGGKDPYSASKAMAEIAINSYLNSYIFNKAPNVRIAIGRAGNVIGGGDWAYGRVVPDCMRAWSLKDSVTIRNPESTRPWQHVLEPLSGYLVLAYNLFSSSNLSGEAYNFGPSADQNFNVRQLIDEMSLHWANVSWKDLSNKTNQQFESGLLKLNCDKALNDLNWTPTLDFFNTVKMTVDWYKLFYDSPKESMYDFSLSQINEYTNIAASQNKTWTKK